MKNIVWMLSASILMLVNIDARAQEWLTTGNNVLNTDWFGTLNSQPINFRTNNSLRMRLYNQNTVTIGAGTINAYLLEQKGFLGIGRPNQWLSGGGTGPYSLLHLNGENLSGGGALQAPQEFGYRGWMRFGLSFTHNRDFMYIGPRSVGGEQDQTRAVIAWSDNDEGGAGPDDFSFLFSDNDTDESGDDECQELMRITGTGNVGIGNFQSNGLNIQPSHRLDVDGQVRIRDVEVLTLATDRDAVLFGRNLGDVNDFEVQRLNFTEDANDYLGGDGLWHPVDQATGNDCDWAVSPLGHVVTGNFGLVPGWDPDACNQARNVGIGTTDPVKAKLDVVLGLTGLVDPQTDVAIQARTTKDLDNNWGIYSQADGNSTDIINNFGGYFEGSNSPEFNYGIYAVATSGPASPNPATGANYGVWGEANGAANPADNWAGFFDGVISVNGQTIGSDEMLKQNIQPLDYGLEIISQLSPKTYTFRNDEFPMNLPLGEKCGFIAQDVEELLPDLVSNVKYPAQFNEAGEMISEQIEYKGISYIELIPILTQGIQEQQAQITSLEERIASLESLVVPGGVQGSDDIDGKSMDSSTSIRYELYQNRPNPFDETTEIVWRMSEDAQAQIIVHDSEGKVVDILMNGNSSKGLHSLEWNASDLSPGTYYYSLEVNGELMVKRAVKIAR